MNLPVDIPSVADTHYENDQSVIMNIVNHTIVANPQAVSVG